MIGSTFRIFTRPANQLGVVEGRVCTFTTFLPTILLRNAAVAQLYRGKLLPLLHGIQSDASIHRPLSLGDDKGSSAAASDRCLRVKGRDLRPKGEYTRPRPRKLLRTPNGRR